MRTKKNIEKWLWPPSRSGKASLSLSCATISGGFNSCGPNYLFLSGSGDSWVHERGEFSRSSWRLDSGIPRRFK